MAKEICISSTPHETRLAILEDDQLAEIYYERENEYTLAGSIYNGRVTRVLPGMQSAFVDVGLERDAFLYVTDFLELEDQEESDEIEKAAVTGGNQPVRDIRQGGGARPGQKADQRPEQRSEQKQDRAQQDRPGQDRTGQDRQGQDRGPRDRRPGSLVITEAGEASAPALQSPTVTEHEERELDDTGAPGAKRWRGRRRRRGGRGAAGSPEGSGTESETEHENEPEAPPATQVAPAIQAAGGAAQASLAQAQSQRGQQAPPPAKFVLPGESLSKYGGTPADDAHKAAQPAASPRPASSFKPSTMIEAPLAWDGSGLLPGESLSRLGSRPLQPASEPGPQPHDEAAETLIESEETFDASDLNQDPAATESAAQIEEEEFVEEVTEAGPDPVVEQAAEATEEEPIPSEPEDFIEETVFEAPVLDEPESHPEPEIPAAHDEPAAEESAEAESHGALPGIAESGEHESDADASHNIDPSPHSGFRLFGLGSKKKKDEEPPAAPPPAPAPRAAATVAVSSYAPGSGLIEEEVIEGEEFDAPHHHHHKADDHDLEDFEEETLQTQIGSGALGEMLQEAHLDHKIQLKFEDKNGDEEGEESFDDDEDEEEEEPAAGAQPSTDGQSQQQRRDRGGRGRRGRGDKGGPPQRGGRGQSRRSAQTSDLPIISDLLKPGQEILVQIAKEPIAKKGARITSHIALPGRFLVFMPTVSHIGVSRKIASDEERQRLKRILVSERGEASGGFIVRTAAEGASEEELRADLRFLLHLWDEIKQRSESSKSPALIYHDLSLIERILRDQVSSNFSHIWVDSQDDYERIVRFLNRFSPTLVRRVKLYTKEVPLFEHFGIQDEISKALRSKVWLKSGGSIVINQTEALVAIDINTGKYVGKTARLEDTILKTNLDAIPEIVRQIRLRDLGGIIVIDFIDMDERKNRFKVMAALEEALKNDRAPTKVLQFNDFGLVAITRKRVKQSLERTLSVPCPTCQATGMVKSPTTVCNEIYTELRKMKKHFEGADVLLRVNPETVKVLKQNDASWLVEFEELVGKNILVKSDATLHPEQFDIQG
jgi:Rne/Rng family ribonuclease